MKRCLLIGLVLILALSMVSCATQTPKPQPVPEPVVSAEPSSALEPESQPVAVVVFSDKNLETAVRKAMNKPEGDITLEEAAQVQSLNVSNGSFGEKNDSNNIKDISALGYFTGLKELDISFNEISDLSPLSKIPSLETLVFNGTLVEDLTPLKGLTNLNCLVFCWLHGDNGIPAGIASLDALSGLTNLEHIDAKNAGITDISALANLPKLWDVQLNENMITDVTPLSNLTSLRIVLLEGNPVNDYSVLKDVYAQLEGKDFELK